MTNPSPDLTCPKCHANRLAEPCGNPQDCAMIGTAYAASTNLIHQVEAESVDSPELRKLLIAMGASTGIPHFYNALIAHIVSIITAREKSAYEAGRIAALRPAPAGQLDASIAATRNDQGSPIANLTEFTDCSIRDHAEFREGLERLSERGLAPKQAKVIRKAIYDDIDARVRNAVKAALAASQAAPAKAEGLTAAWFHKVSQFGPWIECNPSAPGAVRVFMPSTPAKEPT